MCIIIIILMNLCIKIANLKKKLQKNFFFQNLQCIFSVTLYSVFFRVIAECKLMFSSLNYWHARTFYYYFYYYSNTVHDKSAHVNIYLQCTFFRIYQFQLQGKCSIGILLFRWIDCITYIILPDAYSFFMLVYAF